MARSATGNLFSIILWQESIDIEDVYPFLDGCGLMCAVSPLHDKDIVNAKDVLDWLERHEGLTEEQIEQGCPKVGEPKKPHWHIIVYKPKGTTNAKSVIEMLDGVRLSKGPRKGQQAVSFALKLPDVYVAVRYLCHLDSPDKAEYDVDQVRYFGGFDPLMIGGNEKPARQRSAITQALDLVEEFGCRNLYELVWCVRGSGDARMDDMLDACVSRAPFFASYLKGRNESHASMRVVA